MTNRLEPDQEAVLERVVCGELAADAPEVRARSASDAAFSDALDEHERSVALLASARADERDELAGLAHSITPDDRALVRELGEPLAARYTRRRFARVLGGVGAAAALALWFARPDAEGASEERRAPRFLGDDACAAPRGAVDSFALFEVDLRMAPGEVLEIVVRDAAGDELARSPQLEGSRWQPTPEVVDALERAGEIQWMAVLLGADGEPRVVGGPCAALLEP